MLKFIKTVYSSLDRNLKNVEYAFKFNFVALVFASLVFGVFGVIPLISKVRAKYLLLGEMQQAYVTMQANMENLKKAEQDLQQYKFLIEQLETYMPVKTDVQSYLLQFVSAAASSGLEVKGFTQEPTGNDRRIDVSAFLVGRNYPTDLIKKIEDLKRVTQVRDITVTVGSDGVITVNLALSIYTVIQ